MVTGSIAIARSVLEWRADPESPWRDERLARPESPVFLICEQGYSSSLAAAVLWRQQRGEPPGDAATRLLELQKVARGR